MNIWTNSDILDLIIQIASGIVAFYSVWELIREEIAYRRGKSEKPTGRFSKVLIALLGIVIFISSWRSEVISKAEDSALREKVTLTQQQLVQRSLTDAEEQDLIRVLKNSGFTARIPVFCPEISDPMILSKQLIRILQNSGWDTETTPGLASPPWQGIIITVENLQATPPSASLLAAELNNRGLPVILTDRQGAPKIQSLSGSKTLSPASPPLDLLNLWVGEKPPLK